MGTHPRPEGSDDALSVRLRAETSAVHREAEARPFMQTFFAGRLFREGYVAWLARQEHIYRALEDALGANADHPALVNVVPSALFRAERITSDLHHLTGGSPPNGQALTTATRQYRDRIVAVAESFAPGLLAHAWLRYMGNVGGQHVLRRLAAKATGLPEDAERGLAFTDYSALGEVGPFFRSFHAALDAAPLSSSDADQVIAEAEGAFRLNIALTDELARDLDVETVST